MTNINTNETAQLLTYVRSNPKISAKLATAFLDIPEEKAWIHLQRLVSTGYLEVKLEANCLDPNCIGVTDVSSFFRNTAGMPVNFECHGCGQHHTVDLDDTNIAFLYQGNLLRGKPKKEEVGTHQQEVNRAIKWTVLFAMVVGLGTLFMLIVGVLTAIVLFI